MTQQRWYVSLANELDLKKRSKAVIAVKDRKKGGETRYTVIR
jgi:hypothetical protein